MSEPMTRRDVKPTLAMLAFLLLTGGFSYSAMALHHYQHPAFWPVIIGGVLLLVWMGCYVLIRLRPSREQSLVALMTAMLVQGVIAQLR
jgi:hypothetical protein